MVMPKVTSIPVPTSSVPTPVVNTTPMMEQYQRLKDKAGDALLFFRMGDFYELFQNDAVIASKALNIALTARNKQHDEPIPMCGVPIHSAENYIDRLLQQGFKVAIAEQLEDPSQAEGLVKRDIVRVTTPGTVVSGTTLAPKEHNFLASIAVTPSGAAFAYVDISTGTFAVTIWDSPEWPQALHREYTRVQPREVLIPEPLEVSLDMLQAAPAFPTTVQPWAAHHFHPERAYRTLLQQFAVHTLDGFGCEGQPLAIAAAGALVAYVHETQHNTMTHLNGLRLYSTGDFMVLDETTRRHLELTTSPLSQGRAGSLLAVIDCTVTAMGGRLLRQWLSQPLCRLQPLQARQEAIAELVEHSSRRARLRQALDTLVDFERTLSRLALGTVTPRELIALCHSLSRLPAIALELCACRSHVLTTLAAQWDPLDDLDTLIAQAIVDDAPATLRDGHVIRPGYHPELDALREHGVSGTAWLNYFEAQERQRTGIASLRIGFNKVFGYYIEVRKAHLPQVPAEYLRKQTLAHAERFITPALKDREVHMLRAAEEAQALERQLYETLHQQLAQHAQRFQRMAQILSELDVLAALAEVAVTRQYCRPTLDDSDTLAITEGRHPVLEAVAQEERFVPNDTLLDRERRQILLLTGPNMAGKSTYMRQVALIVILAQIGSFVPARAAHIGLVDRVFTRVGAQDMLGKGQSTFMVEMTETANILHNISTRSLVLLDEIGRGTSTYDGISIAWAVVEYLHDHGDLRPRTLFATHYHELTALATSLARVHNYSAAVQEHADKVLFLRRILPGSADRSYGVQVARLAGLPALVLQRAQQLLARFESSGSLASIASGRRRTTQQAPAHAGSQLSLFESPTTQLLQTLRALEIDHLSPNEATAILAELQQRARRLP
jgi:DNA mismatch repair protein MutS